MKCIICFNKFKDETKLNCGHSFCAKCIKEWYYNNHTCPICRQPFQKNEIYDNIQRMKTRHLTKNKRYETTNNTINKFVNNINKYNNELLNTNNLTEMINIKKHIKVNIENFFKMLFLNRNLYECKYKKKADNLCIEKKMCDYNYFALKCENCKFKHNLKNFIDKKLNDYGIDNFNEWIFKFNEVKFFS